MVTCIFFRLDLLHGLISASHVLDMSLYGYHKSRKCAQVRFNLILRKNATLNMSVAGLFVLILGVIVGTVGIVH